MAYPSGGGYCELADIQRFNLTRTYSASGTSPTTAQIDSFITDIFREINTALDRVGYSTAISETDSPKAHRYLRYLNALGAAGLIEQATFQSTAPSRSEHGRTLLERFDARLKELLTGTVVLEDAVGGPTKLRKDIAIVETAQERDDGTEREPFFTLTKTF